MFSMPHIRDKYWDFYVDGREARALKHDIDVDDVANKLRDGDVALRDAVLAACVAVAQPLGTSKAKRKWIDEHQDEIAEAGGSAEQAHDAWVRGRVDELAYMLEPEVINAVAGGGDEDPSGDDDDDSDDPDDGDDDEA
jgi:hypothetical protein